MAQAKAQILGLIDDAAAGGEVEITRHGRAVARLVPASGADALRGRFIGVARSVDDDEALYTTCASWTVDDHTAR